jgi:hypothetical protein
MNTDELDIDELIELDKKKEAVLEAMLDDARKEYRKDDIDRGSQSVELYASNAMGIDLDDEACEGVWLEYIVYIREYDQESFDYYEKVEGKL